MTVVIEGLTLREENIRKNLSLLQGVNMAESVMVELTRKGMDRQRAHELVRGASMEALARNEPLEKALEGNHEVMMCLSKSEIHDLLDPYRYIGTAVEKVERLDRKLRAKYLIA
jgi:adenylosuccinate lyase